jgi:hypothetical protein
MGKQVTWTVSYYVAGERYWQFAGEGSREWARERAAYLRATGHETRIRFKLHGEPISAIENR